MAEIDRFLSQMMDNDASDFHLSAGLPPRFRIHGDLADAEPEPPAAQHVDLGGLLGNQRGLTLRQDQHAAG